MIWLLSTVDQMPYRWWNKYNIATVSGSRTWVLELNWMWFLNWYTLVHVGLDTSRMYKIVITHENDILVLVLLVLSQTLAMRTSVRSDESLNDWLLLELTMRARMSHVSYELSAYFQVGDLILHNTPEKTPRFEKFFRMFNLPVNFFWISSVLKIRFAGLLRSSQRFYLQTRQLERHSVSVLTCSSTHYMQFQKYRVLN